MSRETVRIRVLLVDDEEEFTEVLAERLRARGLTVETAADGPTALQRVSEKVFDTVVLDVRMPGMDGIETLGRLQQANPDLQIIFLTGRATVQEGVEAMRKGAFEFLEKPVDLDRLLELLKKAQDRKQELDEEKMLERIRDILRSRGW